MAIMRLEADPPLVRIDVSSITPFESGLPPHVVHQGIILNLPTGISQQLDDSLFNNLFEQAPSYTLPDENVSTANIFLMGLGTLRSHLFSNIPGVYLDENPISPDFQYSFDYQAAQLPVNLIGDLIVINDGTSFSTQVDAYAVDESFSFSTSEVNIEINSAISYSTSESNIATIKLADEISESDVPEIVESVLAPEFGESDVSEFPNVTTFPSNLLALNDIEIERVFGIRYAQVGAGNLATQVFSFAPNDISPSGFNVEYAESDVASLAVQSIKFAESRSATFVTQALNYSINFVFPVSESAAFAQSDVGQVFSGGASYSQSYSFAVDQRRSLAQNDVIIPTVRLSSNISRSDVTVAGTAYAFATSTAIISDNGWISPLVRNEAIVQSAGVTVVPIIDTFGREFDIGVLSDPLYNEYVYGIDP